MSVSVRYWRGSWVVDISIKENGKRKRLIESFGPGLKAKAAAELYRDDVAPQVKVGKFWQRQTATFADLWAKFESHELIGPAPGPATVADYKSIAANYLLPRFGDRLLKEIDTELLMDFKASLLTQPGVKASAEKGSGRPLSPRTVAKILTLVGTVFRYGKRIKFVTDNPAADVRKPKAAKKPV